MINTYMRYSELIEITFEQTLKEAFDEYQVLNESNVNEAGLNAERQENGFVKSITDAIANNGGKPINLIAGKETIKGVTGATKYTGRQDSGSEPYTDIVLETTNGNLNLSMKGPSAPSLAGGGLRGIQAIIPDIGENFFTRAYDNLVDKGYKAGDKIPDTVGKLNDKDKMLLVVGTKAMGGPIDFMYIGPMDVTHEQNGDTVKVNGSLYTSKYYAETKDLYFRLRARRIDQTFDPEAKYGNGVPKIYGKSPSRGDSAGRLVITDKPSSKALMIIF